MSVTLPPEVQYGFVVGRWLTAVADSPADSDDYPDAKPAVGSGTFRNLAPTSVRLDTTQNDGTYVGTIKEPINVVLGDDGELKLALSDKVGVWLIQGTYDVDMRINGQQWPRFQIVVGPEHTPTSPLDLLQWSPIAEGPTVKLVVSEAMAIRAEEAALRAEVAAAAAEDVLSEDIATAVADWLVANPLDTEPDWAQIEGYVESLLSSGGSIHVGDGPPPDFIYGARIGDVYIDTETGDLYKLGE